MKHIFIRLFFVILSAVTTYFYIHPLLISGDKTLGVILGLALATVFLFYAIFFNLINKLICKIWSKTLGKFFLSIIAACMLVIISFFAIACYNIVKYSKISNTSTQYAIILGCKVDGETPGIFLRNRINAAFNYLNTYPDSKIILSGGQGPGEDISEAQCMYNELIQKGISSDRMILEDKSTSTKENFENSKNIMETLGIKLSELTIITNDFHEYRACKFAETYGIKAYSYPSKSSWKGFIPFMTREAIAVILQIYIGL